MRRRPRSIKRFKKSILEFIELQSRMAAADRNPLKREDVSRPTPNKQLTTQIIRKIQVFLRMIIG